MKRSLELALAALLGLTAGATSFAGEPASASFKLHRYEVYSNGGGAASSTNKGRFTFGGLSTGTASSASYNLSTGFQKIRYYPGTISTLDAVAANGKGKINLSWTAPGSEGGLGDVDSYVIKYASYAITNNDLFAAATTYVQSIDPAAPGASESLQATGFTAGQTYFFSMKATQGTDVSYLGNSDSQQAPNSGNPTTIAVAPSTPSMEGTVRVTTVTVTLTDADGERTSGFGVDLQLAASPATVTFTPDASPTSFALSADSTGQAQITVREDLATIPVSSYSTFFSSISVRVQNASTSTLVLAEDRATHFSVAVSTALRPDLRVVTATVTLLDASSNPVAGLPVALSTNVATSPALLTVSTANVGVFTNGLGQATFQFALVDGTGTDFDDFDDFGSTGTYVALSKAAQNKAFTVESNRVDDFEVFSTTRVAVGVEFPMSVFARNKYDHRLTRYNGEVFLTALISGSNIQSTGNLGIGQGSIINGEFTIPSQTYNKVENIQVRALRTADGKFGKSPTVSVTGPSQFEITLPTQTLANGFFTMTIRALDDSNNQVVGYANTLSLSAVLASNTSEPGTGNLGVSAVGFPTDGILVVNNQSYTRGETVRIKIEDTALGISSLSPPIQFTLVASNIDHFQVISPTASPVGVSFPMTIVAVDASSQPVSDPVNTRIDLAPVLFGTEVAGSGNLAVRSIVIPVNSTHVVIPAQSYNRIETIEVKVQDDFGKKGRSDSIRIKGPSVLEVSVPTTTVKAGDAFRVIVVAKDESNQTVEGYNGNISLSAVNASSTTQAAGGILGLTTLQVVAGVGVTEFQSYTKSELIKIRAFDTAINAVGFSNTLDIGIGPPASLTMLANPGSIINGELSTLVGTVKDDFGNNVPGSTVTFTVSQGSGTLSRDLPGLVQNLVSTTAVTDSLGRATVLFGMPPGLTEAQTNIAKVQVGALQDSATIFVSVLIPSAGGGVAVQSGDPRTKVTIPSGAYSFDVSVSIKNENEVAAALIAAATRAFAKQTGQFVEDFLKQVQVFQGNTQADAGTASQPVGLQFPFDLASSTEVEVAGLTTQAARLGPMATIQGVLVPASVLRIYKLNQAEEIWEQVSEGTFANVGQQVVTSSVSAPSGLYALGTPPFQDVSPTASATLATALSAGATVELQVPVGAFDSTVRVTVDSVGSSRLQAPSTGSGLRATGLAVEIQASGLQPKKNLQIIIKYTAAQIAGFDERLLRVARYEPSLNSWILLDSQVDARNRRIIGFTNHLSLFQVMQVQPQATLDGSIVYPNPFRPTKGHTFLNFGSMTPNATVKVFTITGRLLRKVTADGTGSATWDVKDDDGVPVPSGVYLALIESGDEKRTIKLAVQR